MKEEESGTAARRQDVDGSPKWYVRTPVGQARQLWRFTETSATRADVTHAETGPGTHFVAAEGETIWNAVARATPWLEGVAPPGPFVRMNNGPNNYFPRMARPLAMTQEASLCLPGIDDERQYLTEAQNQLTTLLRQLQSIARVVQPSPGTLGAYGHEIRNLLILTATEIEMHWRGVLGANGDRKAQPNTKDFVKLAGPMRLGGYRVRFHPYPDLPPIAPFADWDASRPTQSLSWYAAYNGVKHNREEEFDRATLEAVFAAVAACAVLIVAQFGSDAPGSDVMSLLSVEPPSWDLEDLYFAAPGEGDWRAVPHPLMRPPAD